MFSTLFEHDLCSVLKLGHTELQCYKMDKTPLLHLWPSEPIASESVTKPCGLDIVPFFSRHREHSLNSAIKQENEE